MGTHVGKRRANTSAGLFVRVFDGSIDRFSDSKREFLGHYRLGEVVVFDVRAIRLRKRHVQELFRMLALDVCGFLGTDSVSAQNGVRALIRFPHE